MWISLWPQIYWVSNEDRSTANDTINWIKHHKGIWTHTDNESIVRNEYFYPIKFIDNKSYYNFVFLINVMWIKNNRYGRKLQKYMIFFRIYTSILFRGVSVILTNFKFFCECVLCYCWKINNTIFMPSKCFKNFCSFI